MTDKEILQKLKDINLLHAPKPLHEKISRMADELPEKHHGFNFPLVVFQVGIMAAVVFFCILVTSGAVAAAKSTPGSFFYPVKQIIEALPLTKKIIPTPTIGITPTIHKSIDIQVPTKKNKDNGQGEKHSTKSVEGITTQSLNPTQKPGHTQPTQAQGKKEFHFSLDIFLKGKHHSSSQKQQ